MSHMNPPLPPTSSDSAVASFRHFQQGIRAVQVRLLLIYFRFIMLLFPFLRFIKWLASPPSNCWFDFIFVSNSASSILLLFFWEGGGGCLFRFVCFFFSSFNTLFFSFVFISNCIFFQSILISRKRETERETETERKRTGKGRKLMKEKKKRNLYFKIKKKNWKKSWKKIEKRDLFFFLRQHGPRRKKTNAPVFFLTCPIILSPISKEGDSLQLSQFLFAFVCFSFFSFSLSQFQTKVEMKKRRGKFIDIWKKKW